MGWYVTFSAHVWWTAAVCEACSKIAKMHFGLGARCALFGMLATA